MLVYQRVSGMSHQVFTKSKPLVLLALNFESAHQITIDEKPSKSHMWSKSRLSSFHMSRFGTPWSRNKTTYLWTRSWYVPIQNPNSQIFFPKIARSVFITTCTVTKKKRIDGSMVTEQWKNIHSAEAQWCTFATDNSRVGSVLPWSNVLPRCLGGWMVEVVQERISCYA